LSKKPTAARFLLLGAAAAIALAMPAAGAEAPSPLDEDEAVRRALSRPALADELRARVDLARADELATRRWSNPEASWSHEQVRADGATSREDVALLSQRFDLSGRRGLRGRAAASLVEAAGAGVALLRLEVEAEARRAFADALAAERRVTILRKAGDRLERVTAAVARRAASGDVAGYDRRRVEREQVTVLGRLDAEEGALARARARLSAIVGAAEPSAPLALRGELTSSAPPALPVLAERLPSRPDLRALELEARSGELQARAAGRWFLPEVELGGGLKSVDAGAGRDSGFAAAVTVPLPLFSRDQDERLRGDALARAARGRLALALAAARAEVAGLHEEATRLAAAAARYRESTADPAGLLRTAEAAYRGGEVGVLELIDAYRAALDADLSLAELEWAARRARIDLDRTVGGAPR
jgi:cobalt-zinc-cadmium efflux system outer membrane protein